MLCVVVEETDRVLSERRMATLRELGSDLAVDRLAREDDVSPTVGGSRLGPRNLRVISPSLLVYLVDRLAAHGIALRHRAPARITSRRSR